MALKDTVFPLSFDDTQITQHQPTWDTSIHGTGTPFIYLRADRSKKVGKPAGSRSLNNWNVYTKHLQKRITMNTLLQIYITVR